MAHGQADEDSGYRGNVISKDLFIAILLPSFVLFLLFQRIHYGIDFSDESFYVALAYRFAMGDQPFVDEYNLAQVAGVLLTPFVSAFLYFHSDQPDGIVLFVRYLHLVFSALVAAMVFLALRREVAWQVAGLAALLPMVFTPLALHSISYITLGSGFFTMGCFLGLWSVREPRPHRFSLLSGVMHGLAAICYPTLVIPSLFSIVLTTIWSPERRRVPHAVYFCTGGMLAGILPAVLLFRAGIQNLETAIGYVLSIGAQGGGIQKLISGSRAIWHLFPHKIVVVVGLISAFILRGHNTHWANGLLFVAMLAIPLALLTAPSLWLSNALPVGSLYLVINLGLIAPILASFLWSQEATRRLFRLVWIPSSIAGLVVFWSSGNGARMAAIGMLPAAIVSLVMLASILLEWNADSSQNCRTGTRSGSVVIALVLGVLLANQFLGLYRDHPIGQLDVEVQSGPYKGIFTTKVRDTFVSALSSDIRAIAKQHDTILFFDDFPAGYLMTNLRPATPTVWLNPTSAYPTIDRSINEKYYARRGIQPDLVVMLKKIPRPDDPGLHYPADDPLIRFVNSRYTSSLVRSEYEIYVKSGEQLPDDGSRR